MNQHTFPEILEVSPDSPKGILWGLLEQGVFLQAGSLPVN